MTLPIDTNLVDPDLISLMKGPPNELLARWRESDPVHWNPPPAPELRATVDPERRMDNGFWVLTRYADVDRVSRDQATFSSHDGGILIWDMAPRRLAEQQAGLMALPPEPHRALRKRVNPWFLPRTLAAYEPAIAKAARDIVDSVARRGECEFVFDIASRLPVYTFCELMGIPEADRERIFTLGNAAADFENGDAVAAAPRAELFQYAAKLAEAKRKQPDESIMSVLVNGDGDGDGLPADMIEGFFLTLSIAGHETTRGTAAHFVRLMNENPDQYAVIRSDPARYIPNAIEEVLRISPPLMEFRRTATMDTTIGDKSIRKGDKIYLSYPAANRDPAMFADPDKFDVTRANAIRHLSFGIGQHSCLGARLARLQLQYLLTELVTRLPDLKPRGDWRYLRSIWFNAIIEMPVEFTPEAD